MFPLHAATRRASTGTGCGLSFFAGPSAEKSSYLTVFASPAVSPMFGTYSMNLIALTGDWRLKQAAVTPIGVRMVRIFLGGAIYAELGVRAAGRTEFDMRVSSRDAPLPGDDPG
jgi:hypothetical protein